MGTPRLEPRPGVTSIIERGTGRNGQFQLRRHWRVSDPRAAVLVIHGMGEHSGRYLRFGDFLAEEGYDVMAFDNQGFGQSGGRRGHIDSFATFLDNIEDLLLERRSLDVPVVLFGHSLGGLMATSYLVDGRPAPDLAVLSAPALGASLPRWRRVAAPIMGRLAPTLFVPSADTPGILSSDESVDEAWALDPLVVRGGTARLGHEVFSRMKLTASRIDRLVVPTYVFHGTDDRLVEQKESLPLADLPAVTYRSWPGLRHECLSEPQAEAVMTEVAEWIELRLDTLANA